MAKKHTPFVIAYDFDGTLASGNMQEYDFSPALEIKIKDFWKKVGEEARRHDADGILTYMHLMLKEAGKKDIKVQRQNFEDFGKSKWQELDDKKPLLLINERPVPNGVIQFRMD